MSEIEEKEEKSRGGPSTIYPDSKLHESWRKASRKYYWKKKKEREEKLRRKEE